MIKEFLRQNIAEFAGIIGGIVAFVLIMLTIPWAMVAFTHWYKFAWGYMP